MYRKLRGRIVTQYGTMTNFADALGVSKATISKYLCGKSDFGAKQITMWCDALEIRHKEIGDYFFAD